MAGTPIGHCPRLESLATPKGLALAASMMQGVVVDRIHQLTLRLGGTDAFALRARDDLDLNDTFRRS